MYRLRPLVFLLLLGAAPAPAEPALLDPPPEAKHIEPPSMSDARAFLPVSCAAVKESCPEATKLLADYFALLDEAFACMGEKPCPLETVRALYAKDRALDEREHRLPKLARADGLKRPFLRLSLFVITAAGLALEKTDPKAEPPLYGNAAVESAKVVEDICGAAVPATCDLAHAVVDKAGNLTEAAEACEKKACEFPEQERLGISAEDTLDGYFRLSSLTGANTRAIFGMLHNARVRIARMLAHTTAAQVAELEAADRSLRAGVEKLEKDPEGAALGAKVDDLMKREAAALALYRTASITSDRTQSLLGGDPDHVSLRGKINASAARLATSRGRLIALRTAKGLGAAEPDASHVVQAAYVSAGNAAYSFAALGGGPAAVGREPRRIPIDQRAVPIAPPAKPQAPPILKKGNGFMDLFHNVKSKDALVSADAQRRLGFTHTLGDPARRAPLLQPQAGDNTCAIVAQQQILMAHGLAPAGDPVKVEALLAKEAKERGFYMESAGTPRAYQADLLVDRGLIVTKQTGAPIATLDAAVRRGGMIIASVDARHIWNQKSPRPLGHAILITGAEVNRFNGETLGYYINDSGVPKNGAGRFVPIGQFRKAWNAYTKSFSEVR